MEERSEGLAARGAAGARQPRGVVSGKPGEVGEFESVQDGVRCRRAPCNAASLGQKTPVLITSKAPHPYQRIMVSYDEPGRAIVCLVSTVRF